MATTATTTSAQPRALVYRGPCVSEGCAEAVADLLRSSPRKFQVTFIGPTEKVKLDDAEAFRGVDVYAQPGGPDLDEAWAETRASRKAIKEFVAGGGRYLGFCLGAYLAGRSPGFGLLPNGSDTDSENDMKGAQVKHDRDAVIEVDWAFTAGDKAGQVVRRWLFFQEGAVIRGFKESETNIVLGRYATSGRIAASLSKYGEGWVGLTGPHPEANQDWFDEDRLKCPDGLQYDIGHDLIEAVMLGRGPEVALPAAHQVSGSKSRFRNPLSKFFGS